MPLTPKQKKTRAAMREHYGKKKGDKVFYAKENKEKHKK